MKYRQYIEYWWYPTQYWALIIDRWEFWQNIDNISIWRRKIDEKIERRAMCKAMEEVCQNIKDISNILANI